MSDDIIYGWHFLSSTGTAYGGYRPPAVGEWEPPIENPEPCKRGYHGSPTILRALPYANGPILGRCEYRGVVWDQDRAKWAARERRYIARVDATALIQRFALHCAEAALPYTNDSRVAECVAVARRYLDGTATRDELNTAWYAADAAWHAAAWYAAHAARYAADAATYAANAARRTANAARYAAHTARYAAHADLESWLESAALDLDTAPEWKGGTE